MSIINRYFLKNLFCFTSWSQFGITEIFHVLWDPDELTQFIFPLCHMNVFYYYYLSPLIILKNKINKIYFQFTCFFFMFDYPLFCTCWSQYGSLLNWTHLKQSIFTANFSNIHTWKSRTTKICLIEMRTMSREEKEDTCRQWQRGALAKTTKSHRQLEFLLFLQIDLNITLFPLGIKSRETSPSIQMRKTFYLLQAELCFFTTVSFFYGCFWAALN